MVEQYNRDVDLARERGRAQQTGHRVEGRWAAVLHEWLPRGYQVVTRKYILLEQPVGGKTVTAETDLVVLHPAYPDSLRDKEEVLAGGVAAAFSVKRTVARSEIVEACEAATELHSGMKIRGNTVREELVPPIIYGLLGESHDWTSPGSEPLENVTRTLSEYDNTVLRTPREALDLVCIADLGCWSRMRAGATVGTYVGVGNPVRPVKVPGAIMSIMSQVTAKDFAPLTVFITSLWQKLALNDPALKPIAQGLNVTLDSSAMAAPKVWASTDVLSAQTIRRIERGGLYGDDWQNIYA
ncbi:hypothetical protein QN239_19190 [Mycolicibacterium sp. Y3]